MLSTKPTPKKVKELDEKPKESDDEWGYGSEHEEAEEEWSEEEEEEKEKEVDAQTALDQAFLKVFLAPYDMRDPYLEQRKYAQFMEVAQ